MKCPNDQTTLLISERQNIEIDYCPECRGVWLDRGELDKLIEKNTSQMPARESHDFNRDQAPRSHHQSSNDHRYKKKHRESFLGDLFDF